MKLLRFCSREKYFTITKNMTILILQTSCQKFYTIYTGLPRNSFIHYSQENVKMGRTFFVREIIIILKDPRLCPVCEKADKLEENVIIEKISNGKTFLCTRCEALIIVTHLNLRRVELETKKDDTLMIKEPHYIRKVSY